MAIKNNNGAAGYFEPELQHTFLPGCKNCGGSHPLARKIVPTNTEVCPDCEQPVAPPGVTHIEGAKLGNAPSMLVARACLAIAKRLSKYSKR